ncbi:MAG: hypothetical protein ACK49D_10420 [Flavobacteriia bacterium]|jgi:hypothetical protein
MELYKQIGIGPGIFETLTTDEADRQKKIYSRLVIFISVTSILAAFSMFLFAAIVFQSYLIALLTGVFLGLVMYNFQRLLIIASLSPQDELLYLNWIDKKREFEDLTDAKVMELQSKADREAFLTDKKMAIRNATANFTQRKTGFFSQFMGKLIFVFILVLFGIIVANGLELFLFRGQINESIDQLLQSKEVVVDSWSKKHIFTSANGKDFLLINSNSLLVDIEFLTRGLGYWKYLMDFIVLIIFLFPIILLNKSDEFLKGSVMRELVVQEVRITNNHYILSRRFILIEKEEYVKWLSNRSYADFYNRTKRPNK